MVLLGRAAWLMHSFVVDFVFVVARLQTILLWAVDGAGNVGITTTLSWRVDATPPRTSWPRIPAMTSDNSPLFSFACTKLTPGCRCACWLLRSLQTKESRLNLTKACNVGVPLLPYVVRALVTVWPHPRQLLV